ncbi:ATP-binding protein [Streptomyces acidiscabies]|uniref:ATP-binding protein n=1 Tax=Streptomyces acidiscabies TaxID=42234 RepID=A0AAP6BLI2_9ACTN|nr:ATP-binding protein [Streptomyces acidiscabies]MBP5938703.1 ATP-binding protein [Streptomyces sp. LBUM 1476]MBZ3909815.1 ATP-binding protein [Streptomyces acidiscabies]MDX2966916.1 ATP-binding protein [Streptomyces acidiscabies]MDX3026018.1 ATP-binding protein [Streptomyces acidiscabies]MDX3797020.1 ATP-binding protein [Streptomyces acidiscabies]
MSRVEWSVTLVNDDQAAGRARRVIRDAMAAGEYDAEVTDAAVLVVSELVTNATRHAPGTARVEVRFTVTDEELVVEVYDGNPGRPVRRTAPADAECGRGLDIVEAVTAEYGGCLGARTAGRGKYVFATLKLTPVPSPSGGPR